MRLLALLFKVLLFLLLLGFAIKNSELVNVRYLSGLEWHAPLSLVLLVAFALGALFGLLSCSGRLFRRGRDLARLRKASGKKGAA